MVSQNASDFPGRLARALKGHAVQHAVTDDEIKIAIRPRQVLYISLLKAVERDSTLTSPNLSDIESSLGQVHTISVQSHLAAVNDVAPDSATQIQHPRLAVQLVKILKPVHANALANIAGNEADHFFVRRKYEVVAVGI